MIVLVSLFLQDAKSHKAYYCLKIIQLLAVFFVFLYSAKDYKLLKQQQSKLDGLVNAEELYYWREADDQATWEYRKTAEDSLASYRYLYRELQHESLFMHCTVLNRVLRPTDGKAPQQAVYLDPEWFVFNNIGCAEGYLYGEGLYQFNAKDSPVPAVVGASLAGTYIVGQNYKLMDGREELYIKVVGILDAGEIMIAKNGLQPQVLDSYMLLPPPDPASVSRPEAEYGYLDMFINNALVFTKDGQSARSRVGDLAELHGPVSYELVSLEENLASIVAANRRYSRTVLIFGVALLILFFLSIAGSQTYKIYASLRTLGIHLLCGADYTILSGLVFLENALICSGAFVFALLFLRLWNLPLVYYLLLFGSIGVLALALSAVPAVILMQIRLATILRRVV